MLITADDLIRDVETWPIPAILDIRWTLGDNNGKQHYCDGHIPGAQYVDLAGDLSGGPNVREGRHPLPNPEIFAEAIRRLGVDTGDTVVVYDDHGSTSAARAWWMLRWAGLEKVFILDGGLQAWMAAGGDLAVGPGNLVPPGSFTQQAPQMPIASMEEAGQWPLEGTLLDVRAASRYAGWTEPVDKRAGHIPGAINLPTAELLDSNGHFLQPEQLRVVLASRGVTSGPDTIVYCGSGIHACHTLAAMEIAGLTGGRLYPGSWSQWSEDRSRPVIIGEEPGAPAA